MKIHRTGTPEQGHVMSIESLIKFLGEVIYDHRPCPEVPAAFIQFPQGFWVTYASPDDNTLTPP